MARKRMIDPGIWQSEDFGKLSILAKLVFIGLFSNADDEGRGRANPTYLKSILFPYEESIRSADIDKTLSEISSNMSVVFYSHDGSNYYSLTNWYDWQKIEKPQESKLPAFEENNKEIQRLFPDQSTTNRRPVVPNRIEGNGIENKRREEKAPTLEEIQKYIDDKKLKNVDAKHFLDFFTESNWIDTKGNKVKNWKLKLLTWNNYDKTKQGNSKQNTKQTNYNNYEKRQYDNLNNLYANKGV